MALPWNAIASGFGSLVGAFSSNKNINKQIKAQQEENEKIRQYNLMLAKQQNQWNLEQWNRENAYNDPSAQMSRLRAAGLNPDLMYQNGASGLQAAASPAMTAGEAAQPVDMSAYRNRKTISDVIQQAQSTVLAEKQAKKLEADAEGQKLKNVEQDSQNVIKKLDAKYHSRFLQQQYQNLVDVHHQNVEQLELLRSKVADMDEQVLSKSIDNDFKQFYKTDYYEYLRNQYRITAEEAQRAEAMTKALIRSANAKADYDEDMANFNRRMHEQDLKFDDVIEQVTGETGYAKLFSAILKYLLKPRN